MNYAAKYAKQIDERFRLGSLTSAAINNDFDFTGAQTVMVYSVPTVALKDYSMSGANRYGEPAELENSTQELTLTRDRAFTFSIDRRAQSDTMNAMNAGEALNRQIEEVVIPEIDSYRLSVIAEKAGKTVAGAVTKSNAYESFLNGNEFLSGNNVSIDGRILFASPEFLKLIKLDPSFISAGQMADDIKTRGVLGMIDNCIVVSVPSAYLPKDLMFVIVHPSAVVSPVKLADYKVHDNPPGINGWLIEGRVYYDAFVLNNKTNGIYAHFKKID